MEACHLNLSANTIEICFINDVHYICMIQYNAIYCMHESFNLLKSGLGVVGRWFNVQFTNNSTVRY